MEDATGSTSAGAVPSGAVQHLAKLESHFPIAGKTLLDIGCGTGDFMRLAITHGADAHGLEVDRDTIQRAIAAGCDPARLSLGDGTSLPFDDGAFDLVSFVFSFHHVPADVHEAMLGEAARVLRPGGHLVAFEPRPFGMMTEVIKLIEDETEVRTTAQARLDNPPAPFESIASGEYELQRVFADFDTFLTAIVNVDKKRAEQAERDDTRQETRKRFEEMGMEAADGGNIMIQPSVYYLLRRN
ncbi:methyltransferase domain-containing protein [Sulfitobacter sp. BDSS02]|nr:methyltransferase domain-containing protein [Sulfitobacter sp. BDSS02]MBR9849738.1 class I SAM-dependent methyltransferase [Paracoccaceae bacterium]